MIGRWERQLAQVPVRLSRNPDAEWLQESGDRGSRAGGAVVVSSRKKKTKRWVVEEGEMVFV